MKFIFKRKGFIPRIGIVSQGLFLDTVLWTHLGRKNTHQTFFYIGISTYINIQPLEFSISLHLIICYYIYMQEKKTYREWLKYEAWRWISSGSISTGFITASWSIDHLNSPGVLTKDSELINKSKLKQFFKMLTNVIFQNNMNGYIVI